VKGKSETRCFRSNFEMGDENWRSFGIGRADYGGSHSVLA